MPNLSSETGNQEWRETNKAHGDRVTNAVKPTGELKAGPLVSLLRLLPGEPTDQSGRVQLALLCKFKTSIAAGPGALF